MKRTSKKGTLTEIVIKNYYDKALTSLQKARIEISDNIDLSENFDEYNYAKEKISKINKAIDMLLDL